MATLATQEISVRIKDRDILQGISVFFDPGLHYLIGLNGSGKTTLLRCLQGEVAYEGNILLNDLPIHRMSPRQRARQMAIVPQHLSLPFQVGVYNFVLMGRFPYLNWLGTYQAEDHRLAQEQLALLGIEHLADRFLSEISGGELQKVYIARALCQQARIMILDEPAQSLDPLNKEMLYALLHRLANEGRTVICATHDLRPLKHPETHVVGLKAGNLMLDQSGGVQAQELMASIYQP